MPIHLAFVVGVTLGSAASAAGPSELESCGPMREVQTEGGRIDYRLKDSSALVKKGVSDLDRYHTSLAAQELRSGSLYRSVKDNLDFTLRHSPNHHQALQVLIQYDKAGGKVWDFPQVECYLSWAQEFAADDPDVWLLGGYYFWTKKKFADAEVWYRRAVELNPDSADAHYNLGLLYVQKADYEQALEHAHAAYARGYPLPGLRTKLEKAGHWSEPSAAKTRPDAQ